MDFSDLDEYKEMVEHVGYYPFTTDKLDKLLEEVYYLGSEEGAMHTRACFNITAEQIIDYNKGIEGEKMKEEKELAIGNIFCRNPVGTYYIVYVKIFNIINDQIYYYCYDYYKNDKHRQKEDKNDIGCESCSIVVFKNNYTKTDKVPAKTIESQAEVKKVYYTNVYGLRNLESGDKDITIYYEEGWGGIEITVSYKVPTIQVLEFNWDTSKYESK